MIDEILKLETEQTLPKDHDIACLIGRAWIPGNPDGPSPVWIKNGEVYDLAPYSPTVSQLLEKENPAGSVRGLSGLNNIGSFEDILENTNPIQKDSSKPWFLAPCDLQAIKASGVTFVSSMLERVIEEQALGDWTMAEQIRKQISELIGDNLADIKPGSDAAMDVKKIITRVR